MKFLFKLRKIDFAEGNRSSEDFLLQPVSLDRKSFGNCASQSPRSFMSVYSGQSAEISAEISVEKIGKFPKISIF